MLSGPIRCRGLNSEGARPYPVIPSTEAHVTTPPAGGWQFVTTPKGDTVAVPDTWVSRPARSGRGIIYQRPGASGDRYSIRIMDPTPRYPEGYAVFYNQYGQPIDLYGRVASKATWHVALDYLGQMPPPGWPPP